MPGVLEEPGVLRDVVPPELALDHRPPRGVDRRQRVAWQRTELKRGGYASMPWWGDPCHPDPNPGLHRGLQGEWESSDVLWKLTRVFWEVVGLV